MAKKKEGHKQETPQEDLPDQESLSDEDFEKTVQAELERGTQAAETPQEEEPEQRDTGEEPETKTEDDEPEPFKLDEPETKQYKVKFEGKEAVLDLTDQEATELLQKGLAFDKDHYRRIGKLIEGDPEAQKILEAHFSGSKKPPEEDFPVSPLEDFEKYGDEAPKYWLMDNLKRYGEHVRKPLVSEIEALKPKPLTPEQQAVRRAQELDRKLSSRDPEGYQAVMDRFNEYAQRLPMYQYTRLQQNENDLVKFYDYIRADLVRKGAISDKGSENSPSFRVRPTNRTRPSSSEQNLKDASEYDAQQWDAFVTKLKGY